MSTKDLSRAAAKKAREELKRVQFEKRLESEQRLEAVRRRGRRVMRTGFGIIAFGFCSIAYSYYTNPSLIQNEIENFKNAMRPTSGPGS